MTHGARIRAKYNNNRQVQAYQDPSIVIPNQHGQCPVKKDQCLARNFSGKKEDKMVNING